MAITILGLGPGNPDHLTREVWDLLAQADEVYLRTVRHPVVASLPAHLTLHSFDSLYETVDSFDLLYDAIADQILTLGRPDSGVVYAVPGHPLVGETSVQRILTRASQDGIGVQIVAGLSFIEPVLSLLQLDGLQGLQLCDATDLASAHHPAIDPDRPALVGQLYSQRLASEAKLTLMAIYPDDHPVTLVAAAGTTSASKSTVPLYELDRSLRIDHLTTLYLPPLPNPGGLPAFQETIARLRAPGGCPWDREQTHQSLRQNLLEEAYEVLDALDAEEPDKLCEELGDLLMQIGMHAQIASEDGFFTFSDIIGRIDSKLKRRHPHVFGDLEVEGTAEVLRNWEAIKAHERASMSADMAHGSRLAGVPAILPALSRAQSLGERAARAGFDWPDFDGVVAKLGEEVAELRTSENPEETAREMGDLLFSMVNVARWLGVDAESALRGTCNRFTKRFADMEEQASARGAELAELSPAVQDALWNRAKDR